MRKTLRGMSPGILLSLLVCLVAGAAFSGALPQGASLRNAALSVSVRPQDGAYEIRSMALERPIVVSRVGAEIDHRWIRSSDYPRRQVAESTFSDPLGSGHQLTITFTGLAAKPDLVCILRLYGERPFGDVEVHVVNKTGKAVTVQAIRSMDTVGDPRIDLGNSPQADRVLSDAFSEDPTMKILDLAQASGGMHRGVGSQLIYNQESRQSLFLGALTSQRFLTILHLRVESAASGNATISSYTVDSTGTTEIMKERNLERAPAEDQIELSLPVPAGQELASERLMFAAGPHYFAQLDAYGEAIRILHHARVSGPNLLGWWSWTAFYGGITQGAALTNAHWLAAHLKSLGYNYFHIDEGYQYARGEYATPNATQFPDGMRELGHELCRLGLKFGIWTGPFEVSGRAWVYEHHKDWLVKNARGKPIQIGYVGRSTTDPLYVLDTTNPAAQEYLRQTYRTLTREWGVRYIKLDFMDAAAVEGYHHRPHTTALEAQRIGLSVIRQAVGDDVLLDKDGSVMLDPVGLVDEGRISVDTGHSFQAIKEAAPNIAARYCMHRNFYLSDPDAFSVSRELLPQQSWHQSKTPLTLDEAQVQITLAAVSGGMFEIGDDLPTLAADADRLALVMNPDLLQMARLSRAALPLDLMTFRPEDEIPSVFLLREDARQAMLAVFNWTEQPRSHAFTLTDLRLPTGDVYKMVDSFDQDRAVDFKGAALTFENQPPHSVRLIRIVDTSVPAAPPAVTVNALNAAEVGQSVRFSAAVQPDGVPALAYHWDFGDGTADEGANVAHTYTRAGTFPVRLTADGVDGIPARRDFSITVTGFVKSQFNLPANRRYTEASHP